MERNKSGQTIAYLRNNLGYIQQDLAGRIGIRGKIVSK